MTLILAHLGQRVTIINEKSGARQMERMVKDGSMDRHLPIIKIPKQDTMRHLAQYAAVKVKTKMQRSHES